jgi:transcriptional regulator with XRE-family HTH domain
MSVERLSTHRGLTKEYISEIEKSNKNPPFSNLPKAAKGLNTGIGMFDS